jgi:hypothetical protein
VPKDPVKSAADRAEQRSRDRSGEEEGTLAPWEEDEPVT